ncbi:MAG: hypothetical protein HQK72_07640 [Desulfamplus sp.]|nr:hypothetical protein [Desulfamplus sp.]
MDNFGNINISIPLFDMGQPSEKDAYITVARDLLQGVEVLSNFNNINHRACALIAAHALECALKAFLWHKGKKQEILKREVRHNLIKLWNMSYQEHTLNIQEPAPEWVKILSVGHGPNFYFRYQKGENKIVVNGGQTPELTSMAIELKAIVEKVEHVIKF